MIYNKVKLLLNKENITAYRLAIDIDLSPNTIYQLSTNTKRIPKKHILDLLCFYFKCNVDDIIGFNNIEKPNHNKLTADYKYDDIQVIHNLFNPEVKDREYLYW